MFIKICGITREKDLLMISSEKIISAVGFIAYPPSPRYITPSKVAELISAMPEENRIIKTAVFVNPSLSFINEYIDAGINCIQLHGEESSEFARGIPSSSEVWKTFRLRDRAELTKLAGFHASKILIDSFSKDARGGTGLNADWNLAAEAVRLSSTPVILAGGLNPDNIAEAVRLVKPYGLDLSSGIESSPGIKDEKLFRSLLKALNAL